MMNLDALDQRADDLALGVEIQTAQAVVHCGGEFLQAVNHQKQLRLPGVLLFGGVNLCLHLLQLDLQLGHLWIEIGFLDQALGIAVNEPGFALL